MALAIAGGRRTSSNHIHARGHESDLRPTLGLIRHGSVPVNSPDADHIRQTTRILDNIALLRRIPDTGDHEDALRARIFKDSIYLGHIV
ncbi:hypothetical protein BX285_0553 [Streptomyces sp. 1114.5]|nr:hypothetical protein BX285_0553 [Streptomyces sp. 1114.5]